MNSLSLGRMLADRRRTAGLTQAALAERMATRQSAISRVEAGRGLPSPPVLERFAAAPRPGLPPEVGGTAEEYWTAAEYHETDLDICLYLTPKDRAALEALGFRREGRHWKHARINVAIEFPDSRIDGDEGRAVEEPVGGGAARIIGLDDLYLDRLRQATVDERREGIEFHSALAVVAARYEEIDLRYVRRRLEEIQDREGPVGA